MSARWRPWMRSRASTPAAMLSSERIASAGIAPCSGSSLAMGRTLTDPGAGDDSVAGADHRGGAHAELARGGGGEVERDAVGIGAAVDHREDGEAAAEVDRHRRSAGQSPVCDPAGPVPERVAARGAVAV